MAVYQILEIGDPILRTKANTVTKFNSSIEKLLMNMADTMYDAEGVGLAAPQIGVSKRVVVVDIGEGLLELINPVLLEEEGEEEAQEGCLSVPGIQGIVCRPQRIKVRGQDLAGQEVIVEGDGILARALLHEMDHLDGVLFIDKIIKD